MFKVKIFQGLIKQFFGAFLQAFLNLLVGQLSNTVLQIVQTTGKYDTWSNEEKRAEAIKQIKVIAINNGKELKDSTVALATEIAVSIWKGAKI